MGVGAVARGVDGLWVGAVGGVGYEEYYAGAVCCLAAAFDAYLFDGVGGVPESGGVEESEEVVAYFGAVFDYVACGAVDVAYDCALVAYEGVEE